MSFRTTPSQTVGPFLSIGLPWPDGPYAVPADTPGAIRIAITVRDGAGEPVPDALVETWQVNPDGFARSGFEVGDGNYEVVTVKPGPVPFEDDRVQAPHIDVSVFARGMLNRCVTRIYFADEEDANGSDPVLGSVPADRRETLLAQPTDDGYRFDIRLQGPGETVFFAI